MPEIDAVLNGELPHFNDIGAVAVGLAYVKLEITKITGSDVDYEDMELPNSDFR